MATNYPQTVPFGRLKEFVQSRSDAELFAYRVSGRLGEDCILRRFTSRSALEAFCKSGSVLHAAVKTPTPANMVTNRNVQREV